jgi:hypothetical protein
MGNEAYELKAYSEACNTLRHYSNASLTVRLASIVQGIAILVAWAVALTRKIPLLMFGLPIAGLLFTVLLFSFHLGYFRATQVFYEATAKMEEKFFSKDCRPIDAYNKTHKKLYGNIGTKFFILNAPFVLITILFIFAFFAALYA